MTHILSFETYFSNLFFYLSTQSRNSYTLGLITRDLIIYSVHIYTVFIIDIILTLMYFITYVQRDVF